MLFRIELGSTQKAREESKLHFPGVDQSMPLLCMAMSDAFRLSFQKVIECFYKPLHPSVVNDLHFGFQKRNQVNALVSLLQAGKGHLGLGHHCLGVFKVSAEGGFIPYSTGCSVFLHVV